MSQSITVLGGGVAGLCAAAELSSRGHDVTVVDPRGAPGEHSCSWWAGGMLAPDCEGYTAEEPVTRLGRDAADWWQANGARIHRNGTLVLALGRDQQDLETFARRTRNHRWLSADDVAGTEPQLAGRFNRALLMTDEAHLDPRATLLRLRERLQDAGVRFVQEAAHTGETVDCRGLHARDGLRDLRGVKGEMVILRAPDIHLTRPVRLLHPRFPLYIVPRGDGVFMLGATQIESGERDRATVRSILELLSAAYALHPAFGEAELLEIGTDARPAFPDNLPRVGKLGDRLYVNGLFRHGFLLAPALARMLADHIETQTTAEFWHESHD